MATRLGKIPVRGYVLELEREYADVQKEIIGLLGEIEIDGFREMNAMVIQRRVDILIRKLNRIASGWAVKTTRSAYRDAAGKTKVALTILGARKPKKENKQLEQNAVNRHAGRIMDYLFRANASIRQSINAFMYLVRKGAGAMVRIQHYDPGPEEEEAVADIIENALKLGQSRQVVARLIKQRIIGDIQRGQFIRVGNRNYKLSYYAEMVARTELREAQTQSVKDKCAEYDNDLVEVSNHGTICEECKEFEGNVYSLSGMSLIYPKLPDNFPPHPQCEHFLSPTSEEALKFREEYG